MRFDGAFFGPRCGEPVFSRYGISLGRRLFIAIRLACFPRQLDRRSINIAPFQRCRESRRYRNRRDRCVSPVNLIHSSHRAQIRTYTRGDGNDFRRRRASTLRRSSIFAQRIVSNCARRGNGDFFAIFSFLVHAEDISLVFLLHLPVFLRSPRKQRRIREQNLRQTLSRAGNR